MVAEELKEFIYANNLENSTEKSGNTEIFLTDLECNFINVAKSLMQKDRIDIQKID